jgi:hypothetical protein
VATLASAFRRSGTKPLGYQWYFNVTNAIANATSNLLTLTNVRLSDAGGYSVTVTNAAGSTNSATAPLTVNASIRSPTATQVWRLSPGDRPYLTSDNNQRGLAYNPVTTNLVMVSRSISNAIYVLDAKNRRAPQDVERRSNRRHQRRNVCSEYGWRSGRRRGLCQQSFGE